MTKFKFFFLSLIVTSIVFTGCSTKFNDEVKENPTVAKELPELDENGEEITTIDETMSENDEDISNTEEVVKETNDLSTGDRKSIYFRFDVYSLEEDDKIRVTEFLPELNESNLMILGNCDEFGSDEYNFALGLKRANSVKGELLIQGYDEDRIKIKSLGELEPICTEHTNECYSQNRRADITVID